MKSKTPWRPYRATHFRKIPFSLCQQYDLWMCGSSGFGSFFDEPEGFRVTDCYRLNGKWYHQTGILGLERKEINEANITHWMRPPKGPKIRS